MLGKVQIVMCGQLEASAAEAVDAPVWEVAGEIHTHLSSSSIGTVKQYDNARSERVRKVW
jgi:hypothetical protein